MYMKIYIYTHLLPLSSYEQIKKLRHVDMETKAVRRHWALLREAIREELVWGPGKMQELRDGCVRLVNSVSTAAGVWDLWECV